MSISVRNHSNASFYERTGGRSTLLAHPDGLKVLEAYGALPKTQLPPTERRLSDAIATALADVIHEPETKITSCLRDILNAEWNAGFTVTGEKVESVNGVLQGKATSGDPDAVARRVHGSPAVKKAFMILEGFVDDNSGEKKIGQAYDYASLISDPHESLILCTLHVDRNKKSTQGMKAIIECFIFVSSDVESKRKIGFLWREAYEVVASTPPESDLDFLKRCCPGIVRCLMCTEYLFSIASSNKPKWSVISDNAAVEDEKSVYKIFDNRFHPTYRKPSNWFGTTAEPKPWLSCLKAVEHFRYSEGNYPDEIGSPNKKRKILASGRDGIVPYFRGAVVVVKYDYLKGTHIAWKISHFAAIAEIIKTMHMHNMVHADIRGFNMLHPIEKCSDCIRTSILIDFDLSGVSGTDIYPPGFASSLKDTAFERAGRPGKELQKIDDWRELASCMAQYNVVGVDESTKAKDDWEGLVFMFTKDTNSPGEDDFAAKLAKFIEAYGDVRLKLPEFVVVNWGQLIKGSGSPDKRKKMQRGKAMSES